MINDLVMNEKHDFDTPQMPFASSIGSTEYESEQTQFEFTAALMKLDRFIGLTSDEIKALDDWSDKTSEEPINFE
ncbi:MAG: hypothetical protein J6V89_02280 [Acetobacter sp.]|nr:hypothetical protein [Acetobacter sp.]